jgi:acetyl/propionyl-CoA carboxylase alpha subunit
VALLIVSRNGAVGDVVILQIGCGDRRMDVEIETDGALRKVSVGGRTIPCDWARLANGHYSLILDGRVFDLMVEHRDGHWHVVGRDGTSTWHVDDPRRPAQPREVEEGRAGLQRLASDMPGKVVRVLVQAGETVAYDQALLVLEAMKMQNEIRSPKSGVVREVGVTSGTAVNTGQFLLSLE